MRLSAIRFLSVLVTLTGFGLVAQAQQPLPDYPQVRVETNQGAFTIELFSKRAPLTVRNFIGYVESGFYEGVIFHRVIPGFVVQGGGYDTDYKRKKVTDMVPNESGNGLNNRRGFVAMARTAEPHSANSQFYINLGDNMALDPRPTRWGYTVFGRVIEGMEVVDQMGYTATGPGPVPELTKDVPRDQLVISSMSILGDEAAEQSAEPDMADEAQ